MPQRVSVRPTVPHRMPTVLGVPFDARAVLLGLLFAALATVSFVLLAGYYTAMFSLLMGWLVVFVVVAKRVIPQDEPEASDEGDGEAGGPGDGAP